jgi:hypothetical protein
LSILSKGEKMAIDYSQNDNSWKYKKLGQSTWETIGQYGCLVTAAANVVTAQGYGMNPAQVNDSLRNRGLFVRDSYGQVADVAGYSAIGAISPHTHFVEQKNWPGTQVAPFAYFDVRNTVATEIIIMLDYHPEQSGIQSHYCRVIGLNSARNDIEIVDSWDGKRKWLSSISGRVGKPGNAIIWTAGKYQKV